MKNSKFLKTIVALTMSAVSAFALAAAGCGDKNANIDSDVENSHKIVRDDADSTEAGQDVAPAASENEESNAIVPEYTGPAAGPSSQQQTPFYELNAKNLPKGALEEAYDDGIFAIPKNTNIRERKPTGTNASKYSQSIQNGTITVHVSSNGKLKFIFASGSKPGNARYSLKGPGVSLAPPALQTEDKELVEIEVDVVKGDYVFEKTGGTIDTFGIELTLESVDPKPIKSIKFANKGTTDYLITQKLDCTGVKLIAVDGNDVTQDVDIKNCTFDVSDYNPNATGEYTIDVTYHLAQNLGEDNPLEFTISYTVKVYAVEAIKLDLIGYDGKAQVTAQQAYLTTDTYKQESNISVIATCVLNGDKITYKLKKDWYSLTDSIDLSTAGKKTVTVSVNTDYTVGNSEVNATYEIISAAKKEVVDNKVTVTVGESGDFDTLTKAVQYLKKCDYAGSVNKVIEIEAGRYEEKVWIDVDNVTLIGKGEAADNTVITCSLVEGDVDNFSGSLWGLNCATVHVTGANFKAYNLAIRNDFDYIANSGKYSGSQAAQGVALTLDADGAVLYNCHLYGNQDTLYFKSGRSYYYKTQIDGNVDFIFGANNGLAYFDECKIVAINRTAVAEGQKGKEQNGYVTAAKHDSGSKKPDYGYIFYKCDMTDDGKVKDGAMSLGRSWGACATVAYIECSFSAAYSKLPSTDSGKDHRWSDWSGGTAATAADFCEYGSTGAGAISEAVAGGKVLTATQAANYTKDNLFGAANGAKVGYNAAFDYKTAFKTLKTLANADVVNPEVSITTATTAKAGDEVTITYTASDNVTAVDKLNVTITVTKDGNPVTLTEGKKFTAEIGVYTVTVTVKDEAGNEASETITITVPDEVKPQVEITTEETAYADDEITITYTASDNVTAADKLNVTITVTKDGNPVTLTDGNKFVAEVGTYTVTVTVRDAAGNEASDTITITVTDNTKPQVEITTSQTATTGDEITITYTASDNVTPEDELDIEITVTKDGNPVTVTNNKFTAEEAGTYTVTVTATDKAGNVGSATIQIIVEAPDTVKPEVTITTATTATAGDEITITYTASDNKTPVDELDITVIVKKGDNEVTLTDNKFTAEEGTYTVTVTVKDKAGNEESATIQIVVSAKVDNSGNSGDNSGNTGNSGSSSDNNSSNSGSSDNNSGNSGNNDNNDNAVVPPAADSGKGGCGSTSVSDIMFIGGATLMGLGILFAVSRVLRKKKEN